MNRSSIKFALIILFSIINILAFKEPLVTYGGGFNIGYRFGSGFYYGPKVFLAFSYLNPDWANGDCIISVVGLNKTKLKATYEMLIYTDLDYSHFGLGGLYYSYGTGIGLGWRGKKNSTSFYDCCFVPRLTLFGGSFLVSDLSLTYLQLPKKKSLQLSIGGTLGLGLPVNIFIPTSAYSFYD